MNFTQPSTANEVTSPTIFIATSDLKYGAAGSEKNYSKGINFFGTVNIVESRISAVTKPWAKVATEHDSTNFIMPVSGTIVLNQDNFENNHVLRLTYIGTDKGNTFKIPKTNYEIAYDRAEIASYLTDVSEETSPIFKKINGAGSSGTIRNVSTGENDSKFTGIYLTTYHDWTPSGNEEQVNDNNPSPSMYEFYKDISVSASNDVTATINDAFSLFGIDPSEQDIDAGFLNSIHFENLCVVKDGAGNYPLLSVGANKGFDTIDANLILLLLASYTKSTTSNDLKKFIWDCVSDFGRVGTAISNSNNQPLDFDQIYPGLQNEVPPVVRGDLGDGSAVDWNTYDTHMEFGNSQDKSLVLNDLDAKLALTVATNYEVNITAKKN